MALDVAPTADQPIDVVVSSAQARLQASFAHCRVRSTSVPERSFVDLGDGLSIPCPELLFFELADVLTYALLLADRLELDPEQIVRNKLEKTRQKYPVEKARGRSTKYDQL